MRKFPKKIEINLITKKEQLEYILLSDDEYDNQVIQPLARMFFDLIQHDIEADKFPPKDYQKK